MNVLSRYSVACCVLLSLVTSTFAQAVVPSAAATTRPIDLREKWVFVYNYSLANDKSRDEVIEMLRRAAKVGYNGVLITDNKFFRWNEIDWDAYTDNLRMIRKAAKDGNMKVIAVVCAQGTDLLSNDTSLAEGQPVVDAPFLAQGGKLIPADDDYKIVNGGFEDAKDGVPVGWSISGKGAAIDTGVKCEGSSCIRIKAATQIAQHIKLKPNRYYQISARIKSEGMDPAYQFCLYLTDSANTRIMSHKPWGIQKTQDWTQYTWEINTFEHPSMQINTGIWGEFPGTVWIDDIRVRPGGLVNVIRRDGCPFKMTSEDGQVIYEEGKDFDGARDPNLGQAVINGNKIAGIYDYWHEEPLMTIPAGSRIKEGQKVLVSYYHAQTIMGYSTMCCMAEPKIWPLTVKHMALIHKALAPDAYCLPHDEIRHQGWDEACRRSGLSPAKLLADNIRRCVEVIRNEDPGKPIYIENDMIDPYMNAKEKGLYYFVKGEGPWYGSWEGLDKELMICNWNWFNNADRKNSLNFWASQGRKQVLWGYYDEPIENMTAWLNEAVGVPGVIGAMYTSWVPKYDNIGKFIEATKAFEKK